MISYIDSGISRHVVAVGGYAIKVPRVNDGLERFLRGLLCNLQEEAHGRLGWPELCPVAAALPGGLAVIMRRARVCTDVDFPEAEARAICARAAAAERHVGALVEIKSDSWGWIDGRLVAVDYG